MSRLKAFIGRLALALSYYLPRRVPMTDDGIRALVARVCGMCGVPVNPSTQQAVAMMVQGLLKERYRISDRRIVVELNRARANQALYNAIVEARDAIKKEQPTSN